MKPRVKYCHDRRIPDFERAAGLTLLEIMVVIMVLAILATLAIPNYLNARKAAQATKTIGLLKTMTTANEQYHLRFRAYAPTEADLINSGFIVDYLAAPSPSYTLTYTGSAIAWTMTADPTNPGVTADTFFFVDQTGVIRFNTAATATSADQPVD